MEALRSLPRRFASNYRFYCCFINASMNGKIIDDLLVTVMVIINVPTRASGSFVGFPSLSLPEPDCAAFIGMD
ncbi:MAG: hypothetical protein QS748_10285 [Candidatus Endonucleobacter bathymodioli]|uniref:Uncharacterized protein n=1 Tax=Candidatus Endonucleibacter bathymodioli TaxID=539814 RepID=A0AA90STH6_9GAMM|nr:hypothetical protein [Candidatus Endonucleobacter bathymodioli]